MCICNSVYAIRKYWLWLHLNCLKGTAEELENCHLMVFYPFLITGAHRVGNGTEAGSAAAGGSTETMKGVAANDSRPPGMTWDPSLNGWGETGKWLCEYTRFMRSWWLGSVPPWTLCGSYAGMTTEGTLIMEVLIWAMAGVVGQVMPLHSPGATLICTWCSLIIPFLSRPGECCLLLHRYYLLWLLWCVPSSRDDHTPRPLTVHWFCRLGWGISMILTWDPLHLWWRISESSCSR